MLKTILAIPSAIALLGASPARANSERPVEEPAHEEPAREGPALVASKGELHIDVSLMVEVSAEVAGVAGGPGDPISLNPDFRYGLLEDLEVGIFHSSQGLTGFWDRAGGGICPVGNSCPDLYVGPIAALAAYQFMEGDLSLAVQGGLIYRDFSPTPLVGAKAAVKARYQSGALQLSAEPGVISGFTERDAGLSPGEEELLVPLMLGYSISDALNIGLQSGLRGSIVGLADSYELPLTMGGAYILSEALSLGAAFGFSNLLGQGGSADKRGLNLFALYRL